MSRLVACVLLGSLARTVLTLNLLTRRSNGILQECCSMGGRGGHVPQRARECCESGFLCRRGVRSSDPSTPSQRFFRAGLTRTSILCPVHSEAVDWLGHLPRGRADDQELHARPDRRREGLARRTCVSLIARRCLARTDPLLALHPSARTTTRSSRRSAYDRLRSCLSCHCTPTHHLS
jgi:hypothetical protein